MILEMYRDDIYVVAHSTEEQAALAAQGWGQYKTAGATYKPLSAVAPPERRPAAVGAGDKPPVPAQQLKPPYPAQAVAPPHAPVAHAPKADHEDHAPKPKAKE